MIADICRGIGRNWKKKERKWEPIFLRWPRRFKASSFYEYWHHTYTSTIIRLLKIQMTSAVWILGILGINNTEGVRVTMVFFWTGKRGYNTKQNGHKHYIGSMWKPRCRVTSVHECIPGLPMYMCETLDLFEWIRGRGGGGDSKTVVWVCISVPIFIIISRSSSQFLLKICYGVLPKFHRRYQELFPLGSWFIAYGRALTA